VVRLWSSLLLFGALGASLAGAERARRVPDLELASVDAAKHDPWFPNAVAPHEFRRQKPDHWPERYDPGELPRWIEHRTIPRDSIDALAIRYGVPARLLRKWNGMSPTGRLNPKEPRVLRVRANRLPPPRERIVHLVHEGESWGSIGRRYGVVGTWVRAWNYHELGSRPDPGERVTVWIEPQVFAAILHDRPRSPRAALVDPGAHSIGTPQAGRLVAGVQLPPGEGYERLYPNSAWGTTFAVRKLVEILDQYHASGVYSGTLIVGVMSRIRGGKIGDHISHQSGRDVDIRLPVREGVRRSEPATGKRVNWDATLALVLAFARSGAVDKILLDYGAQKRLYRKAKATGMSEEQLAELLQYPRGSKANSGIVRHSSGHEGHIHVRFSCGPLELEPACGE
jgi:murein endopeptidase